MVMHLACCLLRMSMNEALIGATINAAYSLGLSKTHGSLEGGKIGDLLVIDAPRLVEINIVVDFLRNYAIKHAVFLSAPSIKRPQGGTPSKAT